ncbi:MAG: UbiA family prenyltransferase [Chloroflexi bacterium]|nr:UbiA family prenyltransferase [Chloroflexota bacterium]
MEQHFPGDHRHDLFPSAANAWNDYMDIEIDKINQPQRPLPSGMVSPALSWRFPSSPPDYQSSLPLSLTRPHLSSP